MGVTPMKGAVGGNPLMILVELSEGPIQPTSSSASSSEPRKSSSEQVRSKRSSTEELKDSGTGRMLGRLLSVN